MNTHYKISKSTQFLKQKLLLMLLCLAGVANAQLSGSYTIDATAATGGTNYATWSAFASAIGLIFGLCPMLIEPDWSVTTQTAVFSW